MSKTEEAIKQKALKMLGSSIGIIEPYDLKSVQEIIFRLQLFLPEFLIQKSHFNNHYLLSFYYEQKQYYITINDLVVYQKNSNIKNHMIESRKEFSLQMFDRKARLIKLGIINGIFFLVPKSHNFNIHDFFLLPKFDRYDNHWIYDIEIYAVKVAREVMRNSEL